LSIFRRNNLVLLLAANLTMSLLVAAAGNENVSGKGIVVQGDVVVFFAEVRDCGSEISSAQVFVSSDGGKSWQKRGPSLEGSEFDFFHPAANGLWLAGIHIAEGPGIDPFIWIPGEKPYEWVQSTIYEGPASLEDIARLPDGSLLAWVRHIDIHRPEWPGALYVHRSVDSGRSWKVSAPGKPMSRNSGTKFRRIGTHSKNWRFVDGTNGVSIQHRKDNNGGWEDVSQISPQECGNQQEKRN